MREKEGLGMGAGGIARVKYKCRHFLEMMCRPGDTLSTQSYASDTCTNKRFIVSSDLCNLEFEAETRNKRSEEYHQR